MAPIFPNILKLPNGHVWYVLEIEEKRDNDKLSANLLRFKLSLNDGCSKKHG
jgi:hypothetical protein